MASGHMRPTLLLQNNLLAFAPRSQLTIIFWSALTPQLLYTRVFTTNRNNSLVFVTLLNLIIMCVLSPIIMYSLKKIKKWVFLSFFKKRFRGGVKQHSEMKPGTALRNPNTSKCNTLQQDSPRGKGLWNPQLCWREGGETASAGSHPAPKYNQITYRISQACSSYVIHTLRYYYDLGCAWGEWGVLSTLVLGHLYHLSRIREMRGQLALHILTLLW